MTSSLQGTALESNVCSQCQKPATFMCSSCNLDGPKYCSVECQKAHWTTLHYKQCRASRKKKQSTTTTESIPLNDLSVNQTVLTEQEKARLEQEEEEAEELHFYTNQIYRIIKPVVACIILSIFWVKVSFSDQSDYSPVRTGYVSVPAPASTSSGNSSSSSSSNSSPNIASSFTNAAIIIGQIIVVTIIIVFLFKKGWIKVLVGFFMLVVLSLLGFMTYILLLNLVQVFAIPLDYITLVFALWNFAAVGLVSIFWKGPLWLQQAYLTIMSSLMAFSLTGLEQWTTWILLGLLAIWDLIAVLCPFGPLRLLLESSKKQQKEVPALLYTVNAVWFMMASTDQLRLSKQLEPSSSKQITQRYSTSSSYSPSNLIRKSHDGFMRLPDDDASGQTDVPLPVPVNIDIVPDPKSEVDNQSKQEKTDEDDQESSGLKLGLGDFVFYSVLIARAAMYDWITTACCTIAVLTGLTATIFLLAIYKKALPALPISIAFGILFYFVAKTVLVPYVAALCVFGMVGL